jgi:hypothetical protein
MSQVITIPIQVQAGDNMNPDSVGSTILTPGFDSKQLYWKKVKFLHNIAFDAIYLLIYWTLNMRDFVEP